LADKNYYLVDSLVLEELSNSDKELLENSLKLYHKAKNDTSKINALNDICERMMHDDWSKYQFFQHNLIQEALLTGPNEQVLNHLNLSLAVDLNNIGYIYSHAGDIPRALEYYHKSLKMYEKTGGKEGVATSLNNIGSIYDNQGDIIKALNYYQKSLKINKEMNAERGIATSLNNIGNIYDDQEDYSKAFFYYDKSLKVYEEIEYKHGIASALNNIGGVYDKKGDTIRALFYFHKSLKIRKEIGDKQGIAISLRSIGEIQLKQGKLAKAKENGLTSLSLAQEIGYPNNIKSAAKLLSEVYERQGYGVEALEMYKLYIQMKDSINNEATQQATAQQQAKYEYDKQKVIDDIHHEKLIAIERQEKDKQRIITLAAGIGLGLVVIFLIFIFNRLRITKKQKLVIEEQKEVVEEAHHELEEKNQEITDSITYAKRIQSAILPPDKVVKEHLNESFILYKPKDIVAGDFYWFEKSGSKVLFAAADCTGHGVPGAMVSVVCNNALNRSVREYNLTDVGSILDKTREIVVKEFEKTDVEVKDGMDIAICSLEGDKLEYAGAYNPLWIIRNGVLMETKANKQPIGHFDNPEPYTTHFFEVEKGDSIYIFSDGYVDQFGGERGKKFKVKAFRELLLSIQDKSMEEQKILIDKTFETWRGELEQVDDVCIIGVRV